MLYLKNKEDGFVVYNVLVNKEKLQAILEVMYLNNQNKNDNKNLKLNTISNLIKVVEGILVDDVIALDVLLKSYCSFNYDREIEKLEKERQEIQNAIEYEGNIYPEIVGSLNQKWIYMGEKILALKMEKFYKEEIFVNFYNQILATLTFDEVKLTEAELVNYFVDNKNSEIKKKALHK